MTLPAWRELQTQCGTARDQPHVDGIEQDGGQEPDRTCGGSISSTYPDQAPLASLATGPRLAGRNPDPA